MKSIKVVAAIIRDGDKIFATQRGYGEFKGGWEFPGGKIEEGETPEQALVREIKEELDTDIEVGELIDIVEYDYPTFHLSMNCYLCKIVSGDLVLKEHEAAKWLLKEELDTVKWLPADITLVDKIKKIKSNVKIPMPSKDEVELYLRKWEKLENYQLQEQALNKLFYELCPENNKMEDILIKAATLNDFYSTNIFSIYSVAKHIYSLDIDKRLEKGDITLVRDIQEVTINGTKKNFYSFATKYCSHHRPMDYPIYDSYVDEVLRYFRRTDKFSAFLNDELKDYKRFKEILNDFRMYYRLEQYNLKQIDQYLWQLGKKYFYRKY